MELLYPIIRLSGCVSRSELKVSKKNKPLLLHGIFENEALKRL